MISSIKTWFLNFFVSDFVGTHLRGLIKMGTGFLTAYGVEEAVAGDFESATYKIVSALIAYFIAHIASKANQRLDGDKLQPQ